MSIDFPNDPFVGIDWLKGQLQSDDVSIVDASWHLPNQNRDAYAEFVNERIPGSVYFDLDKIADTDTDLPHMTASAQIFAESVGALGVSEQHKIIIYDSQGLFSAARVWWNFKIMGAKHVYVLNGGLPAWKEAGLELASGHPVFSPKTFQAEQLLEQTQTADNVLQYLSNKSAQIIDVRSNSRFLGETPEPRAGLRSGHMPNALNLPFSQLVEHGTLRPRDELQEIFENAGVDLNVSISGPIVATCGSGVTAPIVSLALASLGIENYKIYDGSWAEWGAREDLPVVKS